MALRSEVAVVLAAVGSLAAAACAPREPPAPIKADAVAAATVSHSGDRAREAALQAILDHTPRGARVTVLGAAFTRGGPDREGRQWLHLAFVEVDQQGRARIGRAAALTQDRGRELVSLRCVYRAAERAEQITAAGEPVWSPAPS